MPVMARRHRRRPESVTPTEFSHKKSTAKAQNVKELSSHDPELRKSLKGGLWPKACGEHRVHQTAGAGVGTWVENSEFHETRPWKQSANGARREKKKVQVKHAFASFAHICCSGRTVMPLGADESGNRSIFKDVR